MSKKAWQLTQTKDAEELTRQFLAKLFWNASTPLVASLLLQACGQDGSGNAEQTDQRLNASMTCVDGRWRPMSGLALSEEVDFAALRYRGSFLGHPIIEERDAAGSPCVRARDPRVCQAELLRTSLMDVTSDTSHFLIVQGDTVRAIESLADKIALLGKIDTPDEALLLVEQQGMTVGCNNTSPSDEATRVSARGDGYRVVTRNPQPCYAGVTEYTLDVDANGTVNTVDQKVIPGTNCGVAGRRPANLLTREHCRERGNPLARYFARTARLEAASVDAFEQLAAELRLLAAPRALQEAARRAAEDEVRHARETGALAERLGARPETPRLGRRRLRSLGEVALDNALEGCVYETYAAYLATVQARLMADNALGAPLSRIAEDETGHAALSWQIASFLEPRLAPEVRRRIDSLRAGAIARLGSRAA